MKLKKGTYLITTIKFQCFVNDWPLWPFFQSRTNKTAKQNVSCMLMSLDTWVSEWPRTLLCSVNQINIPVFTDINKDLMCKVSAALWFLWVFPLRAWGLLRGVVLCGQRAGRIFGRSSQSRGGRERGWDTAHREWREGGRRSRSGEGRRGIGAERVSFTRELVRNSEHCDISLW